MSSLTWDSRKRESNLRKHGIDFADLEPFFADPYLVEQLDARRDYGEKRVQALAQVEGVILYAVYTWRDGKRRLISARKANRDERQVYQERKAGS